MEGESHWYVGGLDGSILRLGCGVALRIDCAKVVDSFGHRRCAVFALAMAVPSQWGQHSIWRVGALVACLHFCGGMKVEWRGVLGVGHLWIVVVVSDGTCQLPCCEHALIQAKYPGGRSAPLHCAVLCP